MIVRGHGPTVVLVPGVQGRWEWMEPAVRALASHVRVVSYSLLGEPRTAHPRRRPECFDDMVHQLAEVVDRASSDRVALCGVSYGGWIALRFAALYPHRVDRLIAVVTPGPRWAPDARVARYLTAPAFFGPAFALQSVNRLYREVRHAIPDRRARRRFVAGHVGRVIRAPASPARMARRVHLAQQVDFAETARAIRTPTWLVTGEPGLDAVVPQSQTLEYLPLIAGAQHVVLEHTGHVGVVTRPEAFASMVHGFLGEPSHRRHAATRAMAEGSHPAFGSR